MDTITPQLQQLAGEAFAAFEQRTRDNGESFTTRKDDCPEWVQDAIYDAHGSMFPDDWRYSAIHDAFGAIADASDDAYLEEVGDEYADSAVDTYTGDRLTWLSSHLSRPGYCDEAQSEGLAPENADILTLAGLGQYMEAREIWGYVVSALEAQLELIEAEA